MIISGRRIRNLNKHLGYVPAGTRIVLGVSNIDRFSTKLRNIGFTETPSEGDAVLPAILSGAVSRFNANGKYLIHRDQPKETDYRQREWTWYEWHGKDKVEQTKIVDVPYERYPRTFIVPPSVELRVATSTAGDKVVVGPAIDYTDENNSQLLHIINLFLEIFRECEVFTENLDAIVKAPVRRLNWEVLPPGRRPWAQLRTEIEPVLRNTSENKQRVVHYRLETINRHNPEFVAVGQAGFRGYVVFGFPTKNLYVLESMFVDNATYVFESDWERLSQLTKAEILNQRLQKDRVIHREGWEDRIDGIIE